MTNVNSRDMQLAEAVYIWMMESNKSFDSEQEVIVKIAGIIASVPGESPGFVGTFTVVRGKSINQILYYETGLPDGDYKLYTSPQPDPDTRRKAIEECAQVCDAWSERFGYGHWGQEIRALLDKPEGETK